MNNLIYRRTAQLMEADVGDELVALDPAKGNCFGFNEVAKSVWQSLQQPKTIDDLRRHLLAEYDVEPEQCAKELQTLLDDMIEKGLIQLDG